MFFLWNIKFKLSYNPVFSTAILTVSISIYYELSSCSLLFLRFFFPEEGTNFYCCYPCQWWLFHNGLLLCINLLHYFSFTFVANVECSSHFSFSHYMLCLDHSSKSHKNKKGLLDQSEGGCWIGLGGHETTSEWLHTATIVSELML